MKSTKDRIRFAIELAALHLQENSIMEGKLVNLRRDLQVFLYGSPKEMESKFRALPTEGPTPEGFTEVDFVRLSEKARRLLLSLASTEFERGKKHRVWITFPVPDEPRAPHLVSPDVWNASERSDPVTIRFVGGGQNATGSTDDVFLWKLAMLSIFETICRCPNTGNFPCAQEFFIKVGKNKFCPLSRGRCKNNFYARREQRQRDFVKRAVEIARNRDDVRAAMTYLCDHQYSFLRQTGYKGKIDEETIRKWLKRETDKASSQKKTNRRSK